MNVDTAQFAAVRDRVEQLNELYRYCDLGNARPTGQLDSLERDLHAAVAIMNAGLGELLEAAGIRRPGRPVLRLIDGGGRHTRRRGQLRAAR